MRFNIQKGIVGERNSAFTSVVGFLVSGFLLSLALVSPAHAATMGIDKEIVIKVAGQDCDFGKLSLAAPVNFTDDARGSGVAERGSFEGKYPPVKKGVVFNWVQIITTNDPFKTSAGANQPYFDPGDQDLRGDDAPFYWNTTLKGKDGNDHPELYSKNEMTASGNGINFDDTPARDTRDAPVNWKSELDLICWMPGTMQFSVLWSGNYGFNIDKDKNRTVFGIDELKAPVLLTQDFLTKSFKGWTLGDPGSCCMATPEPGMFAIIVIASIVSLARRRAA